MTVQRVRVGDVLHLDRKLVTPDPTQEYTAIGIRSFGKGIFHYPPQTGDKLGSLRFYALPSDRLVVSNIKGWEGAIAVSSTAEADCVASNRFLTYAPTDDQIDVRWARWYFLSEAGLPKIQQASPGSADRNRTLAIERFEALEIPLPPIADQRRIAARLDTITQRATALLQLSERASTIASALAVSSSSRPDLDDDAKSRAGWRQMKLGEFLTPTSNQVTVEAHTSYRIAGIYSFGKGLIDRGSMMGPETAYPTFTVLAEGDVVVSKLNGWEGAVAVVPPRFATSCVSPEFPTFRPDPRHVLPTFFGGIARSPWFWRALDTNTRGSMVRRRRINSEQFLATAVWLPPMDEQARIARALESLDRSATVRASAVTRVQALVPAALNQAFADLS